MDSTGGQNSRLRYEYTWGNPYIVTVKKDEREDENRPGDAPGSLAPQTVSGRAIHPVMDEDGGEEMSQGDKLILVGLLLGLGFLGFFIRYIWPIWVQVGF